MTSTTIDDTPHSASIAHRLLPILRWLPGYRRKWLVADVLAGLAVWAVMVPEGMAYAGIVGVPPVMGLYTIVPPLIAYALLGTSRLLVVGPDTATGLISALHLSREHRLPRAPAITLLQDAMPRPGLPLVHFNDRCCGNVAELRSVILKARRLADDDAERERADAAVKAWLRDQIGKQLAAPATAIGNRHQPSHSPPNGWPRNGAQSPKTWLMICGRL